MIYGVEGYLVDDLKEVVEHSRGQSLDCACVVFDLETTGLSAVNHQIIEIGAVKVENGKITDRFSTFVNPQEPIPFKIEELTGISDEMVMKAPAIEEILPEFLRFCEGCVLIMHPLMRALLRKKAESLGFPQILRWVIPLLWHGFCCLS